MMGIDFDPDVVAAWRQRGQHARYGDAEDPEFAASLPLHRTRFVVSSVPLLATNLALLQAVRNHGFDGAVALTAHTDTDAQMLRDAGATLVLRPFLDAADQAADLLAKHLPAHTVQEPVAAVT